MDALAPRLLGASGPRLVHLQRQLSAALGGAFDDDDRAAVEVLCPHFTPKLVRTSPGRGVHE